MGELAPLISDLALILICAGIMTLIFKKLKQPLVLGYIVAGFIASPHFAFTPSVIDAASIHVWSDIGVIFLLFALGLEFSFKKIVKVGGPAIIATLTIIFGMIVLGFVVGSAFGWSKMDALFLGGMICMSSTTIIYKAFEDLGLSQKRFAGLVMSILILEDILAVVLMVVLSTVAVSSNFEGGELVKSIFKLVFFLVLWLVTGIYLIPQILRKLKSLMNDETLLVVSLGLCFMMVVIAAKTGFSAAFGAFIMGSILAETLEAEHIERLVKPVKDLFGAIFFVSVGMMVDPAMIAQYWLPILIITLTVIIGQPLFATIGVLISGQPIKTAVKSGFSLSQIGEFSFIIASLGVTLGVTSSFLYPIVVAVSVVTIFLTPYMIKLADPAYSFIYKTLPESARTFLDNYADTAQPRDGKDSLWSQYLGRIIRSVAIYAVICIAICAVGLNALQPLAARWLPDLWARVTTAVVILTLLAPFLRNIMIKMNKSREFMDLWAESPSNRAPLVTSVAVRFIIAIGFVVYVLGRLFNISVLLLVLIALGVALYMVFNRWTRKYSHRIEDTFLTNLRSRDLREEYLGNKRPEYATDLMDKDLHLADYDIPAELEWAGSELGTLNLGKRFGVHIVSILRGSRRINIPKATEHIFPGDRVQVIGTDAGLEAFGSFLKNSTSTATPEEMVQSEMILRRLTLAADSTFVGKTLKESGIRNHYHCLVAGIERGDGTLHVPDAQRPLEEGDTLWLVGEQKDLEVLLMES